MKKKSVGSADLKKIGITIDQAWALLVALGLKPIYIIRKERAKRAKLSK